MTTIAYKDGVIACDARITNGTTITYDDYDKVIERDGVSFVLCGYLCDYAKLIGAWFGETFTVAVEASALVYDGNSLCYAAYDVNEGLCKTPILMERPYAIGSGSSHALTAMDMGATAYQAVEMAMKRDSCTGGKIRTLTIKAEQA